MLMTNPAGTSYDVHGCDERGGLRTCKSRD